LSVEFPVFARLFRTSLPAETVLDNPGGGTSTIIWCAEERVCYRRGNLRLYIDLCDLHAAYDHFAGREVTTQHLKSYAPALFDSARKGHDCHCTFFFLALERMGLVTGIWGRGRAGSPFGVTIAPQPDDAESDPAEVACAWEEEIRRRVAEVHSGTAELIPAEEVIAELRRRRAALEKDGDSGQPWRTVLDHIEGHNG
jgi:hypothetical protein